MFEVVDVDCVTLRRAFGISTRQLSQLPFSEDGRPSVIVQEA